MLCVCFWTGGNSKIEQKHVGSSEIGVPENEKGVQGQVCEPFGEHFWDQFADKCNLLVKKLMQESTQKKNARYENE